MKLFLLLICLPILGKAQDPGRPDDSLRKVADTMHYPAPFAFTTAALSTLPEAKLLNGCTAWLTVVKDSLQGIVLNRDVAHKKITATNVPATADISCSVIIAVKGNRYTVRLQDYLYHSINGNIVPVEKAATIKSYMETVNIERVIIMRKYPLVFQALASYLEKYGQTK